MVCIFFLIQEKGAISYSAFIFNSWLLGFFWSYWCFILRASNLPGKCSITWATPPALFALAVFQIGSPAFCLSWLPPMIFLISTSQVSRIISISHFTRPMGFKIFEYDFRFCFFSVFSVRSLNWVLSFKISLVSFFFFFSDVSESVSVCVCVCVGFTGGWSPGPYSLSFHNVLCFTNFPTFFLPLS
jgi:hypothetical protein